MAGVRVLIENPDGAMLWASERLLARAGFEVTTCTGQREGKPCLLLTEGCCSLAQEADVIVNGLPLRDQAVHEAQQQVLPDVPVVLQLSTRDVGRLDVPVSPRTITVSPTTSGPGLVDAVTRAARLAGD